MFEPASKEKISKQIVQQIRNAILQGKLKPGQALPSEKELVAQFGVSKHTLREALRALEALGLIVIRRGAGGGPFVSEIDWGKARDYFASFLHFQKFTLDDITEVRLLVEPYITRMAAERIQPEELAELEGVHKACIVAFQKNKHKARNEAEVAFHVLLSRIAGNPFLLVLQDFVNHMLADVKHKLKPGKEFATQVIDEHERILAALRDKNAAAAQKAMHDHILEIMKELHKLGEV